MEFKKTGGRRFANPVESNTQRQSRNASKGCDGMKLEYTLGSLPAGIKSLKDIWSKRFETGYDDKKPLIV